MKIFYIGCVKSSYRFLKALIEHKADIAGVATMRSSTFNSDFTDLAPLCLEWQIPYLYVTNINTDEVAQFIQSSSPDIGFCFGWSQLIKNNIISMFPMGMVGYHPAALPNNRGRHPIIWALALGLEKTASSFFMLEDTPDTGDILSQVEVDILYEDTADTLMKKLLTTGEKQIITLWHELENNTVNRISQSGSAGNTWRKRNRLDGQIDWRMSAQAIYNLVRALTRPYIGAHFIKNKSEIKVWRVREIINNHYRHIEPGKIIEVNHDSFCVKAGDNLIEVLEYDPVDISVGEYL